MQDLVLTRAEFARLKGFKQPYVNELISKGVLSGAALLPDGRIVVNIAEAQIGRHADPARGRRGRHILSAAEALADPTYASERAKHERVRTRLAQLQLDRETGKVVDGGEVVHGKRWYA